MTEEFIHIKNRCLSCNKDHKMNIQEYIQLFTNLENDRRIIKASLSKPQLASENLKAGSSYNCLSVIPYQLNLKNSIKAKLDDLRLYFLCILEKYFKVFQQKHEAIVIVENSSNKSDISYVTASSVSERSYLTTAEDFHQQCEQSNCELESEISFDSGMDEGKRELIRRLLRSKASDYGSEENIFLDCPTIPCTAQDSFDTEIEEKEWDDDLSDHLLYEDRISRYFITTEDPESVPVPERSSGNNSRQYFMNLPDEHFCKFEKRESLRDFEVYRQ